MLPWGPLLLLAALVAIVCRRLRLPYSVGLLVAGLLVALVPQAAHVELTRDFLFGVLLPPLVFEAALALEWPSLRRDLPVLLVLATVGVLLAALTVAVGMHACVGWPWPAALVFGVLMSATDPVAVIATFKDAGVQGRLRVLVEAESLLNDGTAAVACAVVLALVQPGAADASAGAVLADFVRISLGGVAVGLGVTWLLLRLITRTDDHLVELTLSTVAAWGAFLAAEHLGLSGVLAAMAAGLLFGTHAPAHLSPRGLASLHDFWEFIAFVANSLAFLLMGVQLGRAGVSAWGVPALVGILLVLLGRVVTVYPLAAWFARSRLAVAWAHQHILVWGGLRGALALALALGLPDTLPGVALVRSTTFAAVGFSVLVQGLTMPLLLRRLGVIGPTPPT